MDEPVTWAVIAPTTVVTMSMALDRDARREVQIAFPSTSQTCIRRVV